MNPVGGLVFLVELIESGVLAFCQLGCPLPDRRLCALRLHVLGSVSPCVLLQQAVAKTRPSHFKKTLNPKPQTLNPKPQTLNRLSMGLEAQKIPAAYIPVTARPQTLNA